MDCLPSRISPTNSLMQKVREWSESKNAFRREVLTRLVNLTVAPIFSALSSLYNALALIKTPGTFLKYTIGWLPIKTKASDNLGEILFPKGFELMEIGKHVLKTALYALNILLGTLVGIFIPIASVKMQEALGLVQPKLEPTPSEPNQSEAPEDPPSPGSLLQARPANRADVKNVSSGPGSILDAINRGKRKLNKVDPGTRRRKAKKPAGGVANATLAIVQLDKHRERFAHMHKLAVESRHSNVVESYDDSDDEWDTDSNAGGGSIFVSPTLSPAPGTSSQGEVIVDRTSSNNSVQSQSNEQVEESAPPMTLRERMARLQQNGLQG